MVDLLEGSVNFGSEVKWWIGVVAPRSAWADGGNYDNDKDYGNKQNKGEVEGIYYNRVKVRVVGYHDQIANPYDLPWANIMASPMMAAGYGGLEQNHMLRGGESVFGFWADGEDEQKPVIMGVFYRHVTAEDAGPPPQGKQAPLKNGNAQQQPDGTFKPKGTTEIVTGRKISINQRGTVRLVLNQKSAEKKNESVSQAAEVSDDQLAIGASKPTCKRDNAIGEITHQLNEFSKILITAQNYANFYVNGVTGVLQNLQGEIDLIASKIAKIMTGLFNGVRDWIFAEIGKRISNFINSVLPEEVKPIFGLSLKEIMDTIYCIFENLIKALLKTVSDFLSALVGKMVNAPICAAEQFVGGLLNQLSQGISDAISPILNSLSSSLGGALGKVNEIIDKALNFVGLIYNFIGCDEFKCPQPSRWDNTLGPSQSERDNANKIFKSISLLNIPTAFDENGNPKQTLGGFLDEAGENTSSIFNLTPGQQQSAAEVAALVGGCETRVLRCGPPTIQIFGGDGIGGFANAVVSNLGDIIGADVIERGLGYSPERPPYVTFKDACGNGAGARGRAIIGDDGGIDRIVIDYGGYGYLNNFGDVITTEGTIPGTPVDGEELVGQIDDVIVTNPGNSYNPGDTITVGNGAVLNPIVNNGYVVDVEVINPGLGFTELPDIEINSETGVGAAFRPVLKFTRVDELSQPLDPGKVVQVINCVSR